MIFTGIMRLLKTLLKWISYTNGYVRKSREEYIFLRRACDRASSSLRRDALSGLHRPTSRIYPIFARSGAIAISSDPSGKADFFTNSKSARGFTSVSVGLPLETDASCRALLDTAMRVDDGSSSSGHPAAGRRWLRTWCVWSTSGRADDPIHGPSENWQFACKFRATSRRRPRARPSTAAAALEILRIFRAEAKRAPGRPPLRSRE